MSDCSIEAMKPKEQPKTCETCISDCIRAGKDDMSAFDLHECSDCEHYCSECDECCKGVPDHQDCMFRCWTPSRAYKLEQLAREMNALIYKLYMDCNVLDRPNPNYIKRKAKRGARIKEMHDKLKSLGVSVDA